MKESVLQVMANDYKANNKVQKTKHRNQYIVFNHPKINIIQVNRDIKKPEMKSLGLTKNLKFNLIIDRNQFLPRVRNLV